DRLVSSRLEAPRERQAALNLEREEPGVQAWRGPRGRERLGWNLRQFASLGSDRGPRWPTLLTACQTRPGSVRKVQARGSGRLPRNAAVTTMTARYKLGSSGFRVGKKPAPWGMVDRSPLPCDANCLNAQKNGSARAAASRAAADLVAEPPQLLPTRDPEEP